MPDFLLSVLVAIFGRKQPCLRLEKMAEVLIALVADCGCDFVNWQVGGGEQRLSLFDFHIYDIVFV